MSFLLLNFPDPALRQPATLASVVPVFLSIYAQAVLAILPNTFILKLSLLPFIVWQAWSCAVRLDVSMGLAKWLGFKNEDSLSFWNMIFVMSLLVMASKSFEWTFLIKKPLRKYEWKEGQDTPVERPLSVANVLLDAIDLFFNHRGIGWSWSSRPFPRKTTPPSSIASALVQTLLHFTALDTTQSVLHLISSSNLLDGSLHIVPHTALVLLTTYLRGLWTYEQLESLYHVAMLIGRIFLRQPASHWPPFSDRPWMATSIRDFWCARWHQFFRHFFTVFGARPLGAVLGRPGAVMGAFGVSGLLHIVGPRRYGDMMELTYAMSFFLLMGIGMILENAFQRVTGLPVRGWFGWLWTMAWMLSWGSVFLGTRGRGGIFAVEFVPNHLRPGKILINGAISLFSQCN